MQVDIPIPFLLLQYTCFYFLLIAKSKHVTNDCKSNHLLLNYFIEIIKYKLKRHYLFEKLLAFLFLSVYQPLYNNGCYEIRFLYLQTGTPKIERSIFVRAINGCSSNVYGDKICFIFYHRKVRSIKPMNNNLLSAFYFNNN